MPTDFTAIPLAYSDARGDGFNFFGWLTTLLFFAVILAIIVGVVVIKGYNALQRLAQFVRESRSNILVSLKKRQQLANQLIDIVQGYAGHERLMHLKVSQDAVEAGIAAAYQQTNVALAQVGALAEKFPELKADGTFRQLMADLQVIEGDLQGKRERYNAACREFNSRRNSIPTVLFAARLGFGEAPYLDFDEAADLDNVKDFVADDGAAIQRILSGARVGALNRSREIGTRLAQGGGQLFETGRRIVAEGTAALANHSSDGGSPETRFWYLDVNNMRRGPVSHEELERLLAAGSLRSESLVCMEGDEQWVSFAAAAARTGSAAPPPAHQPGETASAPQAPGE